MRQSTVNSLKKIQAGVRTWTGCCTLITKKFPLLLPPQESQRFVFISESPKDFRRSTEVSKRILKAFEDYVTKPGTRGKRPVPIGVFFAYLFGIPQGSEIKKDFFDMVYWTHAFKCPPRLEDRSGNWKGGVVRKGTMARYCKPIIRDELDAICKDDTVELIVIASSALAYQLSNRSFTDLLYDQHKLLSKRGVKSLPPISEYLKGFKKCNIPAAIFPNPSSRNMVFNLMYKFRKKTGFEKAVKMVRAIVRKII